MDKADALEGAIVVVPRSVILNVWRALGTGTFELSRIADAWTRPSGAAAALEGQATVTRIALDELTRALDRETVARAMHPSAIRNA